MSDPFVGEIRIVGFNFAPRGWALCDGQLIAISQMPSLYSVVGTTYGGDGESTFALPDLRGRVPMHPGQGPGLSEYALGESGGTETVTLLESELPAHSHRLSASPQPGQTNEPDPTVALAAPSSGSAYKASGALADMGDVLAQTGQDQPHNNLQPYVTLYFAIALTGTPPPRP